MWAKSLFVISKESASFIHFFNEVKDKGIKEQAEQKHKIPGLFVEREIVKERMDQHRYCQHHRSQQQK